MHKFFLQRILFASCIFLSLQTIFAKDIPKSIDSYIRESYMPAKKYKWRWTKAPVLKAMIVEYEKAPEPDKKIYLEYVRKAMDKNMEKVNGKTPNAISSAVGLAFLARVTGEVNYKTAALKVYADYLKINRTEDKGVSHKARFIELWDDTIYMIGEYLLEMYRMTGDEKYLEELCLQIRVHRDHLKEPSSGLWVHGYDADNKKRCNFCGQTGWGNNPAKRSNEVWGRGNGWVIVTLSDALKTIPQQNPLYAELSSYLKEMISSLPALQDSVTGHWYQLPVRKNEPGNFIESSATAMFAYGILTAIQLNIVPKENYEKTVQHAYKGLQEYSMVELPGNYTSLKNVCMGTCIGDKNYYFHRKTKQGTSFGLGVLLQFSLAMENYGH